MTRLYVKRDAFIFSIATFLAYVVKFNHHLRMVIMYRIWFDIQRRVRHMQSVSTDKQVDDTWGFFWSLLSDQTVMA
jgi:hypothetical protein